MERDKNDNDVVCAPTPKGKSFFFVVFFLSFLFPSFHDTEDLKPTNY